LGGGSRGCSSGRGGSLPWALDEQLAEYRAPVSRARIGEVQARPANTSMKNPNMKAGKQPVETETESRPRGSSLSRAATIPRAIPPQPPCLCRPPPPSPPPV
jgi:hypothetical protein